MEGAKPGHTVRFQGLNGAAHLNGTEGTLVKFAKKEGRWSVRCDGDNSIVNAKPENLQLMKMIRDSDYMTYAGSGGSGSGRVNLAHAHDPSSWARGLSKKDQFEWLCNCYQMRCDDDYVYGGCNLHGPYNPDATPESIADDFLVFCVLASKARVFPFDWSVQDVESFLKTAPEHITFAFEKSDAKVRWGSENYFEAEIVGGRSLRYTAEQIYKTNVQQQFNSPEHIQLQTGIENGGRDCNHAEFGGAGRWNDLLQDLRKSKRFS